MLKIILLLCKSNYRKKSLNNFYKQLHYKNIIFLSFCGPLLFFLGKLLSNFKHLKIISIDGDPLLKNKKKGINIWFGGTYQKIPHQHNCLSNNYTNMIGVYEKTIQKKKLFQLYPIIKKKKIELKKQRKIIFISSLRTNISDHSKNFWKKHKTNFLQNLSFYNSPKIFNEELIDLTDKEKFIFFREIQTLNRIEIINQIYPRFKKKFLIFGNSWSKIINAKTKDILSQKKIHNLYKGNICLDLGSNAGSLSLYPRSIEIIENNGALIQLKQLDAEKIYQNYCEDFTFTNINTLITKIKKLLIDDQNFQKHLINQQHLFKNSKDKIFVQLDKLFKFN